MKIKVIIDKEREEEVIVYAQNKSRLVEDIEKLVLSEQKTVIGYYEDEMKIIPKEEVECFIVENGKVYALLGEEKLKIKNRLCNLEEILDYRFIKINQSCIANIERIKNFKADAYGSLRVVFKNGYSDYVSRRNLKSVKERLGV